MNFWKQLAIITLRKVNQVHFSQMSIRYVVKINISKRKFVIKLKRVIVHIINDSFVRLSS